MPKEPEILFLPITSISPPDIPHRPVVDDNKLRSLAQSIAEIGLINPVIVRPIKNGYVLIDGNRRLTAFALNNVAKIPALIVPADPSIRDRMTQDANLRREDANALQIANFLHTIITKSGITQAALSRKLGLSEPYVSEHLAARSWHPNLRNAITTNRISFSSARFLSKITDDAYLNFLLSHAIKSGITPSLARRWLADWRLKDTKAPTNGPLRAVTYEPPAYDVTCPLCTANTPVTDMISLSLCPTCNTTITHIINNDQPSEPAVK